MFIILDEISNKISVLKAMFKEDKYIYYYFNKMLLNSNNNVSYKKINMLLPIFLTTALILGPTAVSGNVFAQGGSNTLGQGINQANLNKQFASCIGAGSISAACNQANNQSNLNTGSNVGGQTAGAGSGSGGGSNTLGQGINQANTNDQFASCIGAGSISAACNQSNKQTNTNTGSNIGGQGAGSGGTNTIGQGINQANTESQFAQCVTGGTLSDSCKGPNAQCVSGAGQVQCDQAAFNKLINMGKTATANLLKK
jgi:hypothetical protein